MRLFIAGSFINGTYRGSVFDKVNDLQKQHILQARNYLESYHYFNKEKDLEKARAAKVKVFLDSGAFSAFTQGIKVDIDAYCAFIKRNADIIEVASVLDSVGNAEQTYFNQYYMEQHGVRPLPCFHYGEDPRYLMEYAAKYEYITLGGMVPISSPDLRIWLDELWDKYLTDSSGMPRLKVHGFGMTSIPLMERYPWYSVDSSSWVQIAAMGSILHPDHGVIAISSNNPSRKQEGRHFNTFSPLERWTLETAIEKVGYGLEELQTFPYARWAFNMWSFAELGRRIDSKFKPFHASQPGLF